MNIVSAILLALFLSLGRVVGVPVPTPESPRALQPHVPPPVLPHVPEDGEAPYIVAVMRGGAVCSGALVHTRWVLTAAHCVFRANVSSIKVLAGSLNTSLSEESEEIQKRGCDLVLVHPSYNGSWAKHDVALVRLAEYLRVTDNTRTIQVSKEPWGGGGAKTRHCQVPGYGVLQKGYSSDLDHRLKVHLLNISRPCPCERQLTMEKGRDTVNQWLCSELSPHSGPCRGDSGGPLVCGEPPRLWGLTSATFFVSNPSTCDISHDPEEGEDHCGAPRLLNIFIDIHPYSAWIQEMTSLTSRASPSCFVVAAVCILHYFKIYFLGSTV